MVESNEDAAGAIESLLYVLLVASVRGQRHEIAAGSLRLAFSS